MTPTSWSFPRKQESIHINTGFPIQPGMTKEQGYIAIMAAIVISATLIVLAATLSITGYFARYNVLYAEYKERSLALAEACADIALLKLASNPSSYQGDEPNVPVAGSDTCAIQHITPPTSGQYVIPTKANFPISGAQRSVTNILVKVNDLDFSIISWEEVPSL